MPGVDMRVGEPRLGGGDETIGNQNAMLASEMTSYRGVPDSVLPRQRKRILRKFIPVRDVKRGGQRRLLADLIRSKYLGDFQHLGLIGLQIGERDRTVGCTKVDAKTETCAHELKVFGCVVFKTFGADGAVSYGWTSGLPPVSVVAMLAAGNAPCRTAVAPCRLLQFDLRRCNCWQSIGVDPHNAGKFYRLRFPAAMDERSRERRCPGDLADETILIGWISNVDGDG
jgi:hypothetical protein